MYEIDQKDCTLKLLQKNKMMDFKTVVQSVNILD
jgi:hypothetical protein